MSRRERKVVSAVFCDLVGFTSQAETMDPEDVEAILRPYHERVRSELEHYGGTVEKFIGDAVMALFGAPVTHEDDPERAVRAALAIREFALEDGLELRVGITTGEALVSLDARPDAGEGMASGDVVNTAARLQSAAPVNGILVDETTHRATRHAVDYAEASPVEAKGRTQPVPVWQALQVHARPGVDVAHESRSELVGRVQEIAVLRDALNRSRSARTSQLVTLVGVPGIGKSRLVHELRQIVGADPELITWRQGRCLAYGDGVTLWALGEIVKAQAGIHEQDPPTEAAEKIGRAVAEVLPESGDASWVQSNLLSLVGLGSVSDLGDDRSGQAFAAWRLFLEGMAERRPLVLVFEDLHWADESLLDFIDELVDWVTDVPLLVVGTARPELLERRPGWGGGKLNATTLAVTPLSDEETARLIGDLLNRPVLAADTQQALLERAGGNPLYAEQFSELFLERGSTDELPLPETLQGIIAARLDGLAQEEKELLRGAAVIGKVFWVGALVSDGQDAAAILHALERKGFVRRQRRTSVEGETELAFAHALVRDVSYGQIARADRAAKHRHVAEWIEGLGRPEDHAEMLAHHWRSALELVGAAGGETEDLVDRARRAFRDAGDRAYSLNAFGPAESYYAEALSLWPDDDIERPNLLFRRAEALFVAADERREDALVEARDALLEAGDRETAAEAEAYLSRAAWYAGHRDLAEAHLERAEELLVGSGPSIAKARVLSFSARLRFLGSDLDDGLRSAQEALALAEELELDELRVHALTTIGSVKNRFDPSSGDAELTQALELGRAVNSPLVSTVLNNLGVEASQRGDIPRAGELYREGLRAAERVGDRDSARFMRGNLLFTGFFTGRWDEVVADADQFIAECESSPHYQEGGARMARAFVRLARGDRPGALADWERMLALARETKEPQRMVPALLQTARGYALLGRDAEARALASEAIDLARGRPELGELMGHVAGVAKQLGLREEMREIAAQAHETPWQRAAVSALSGDFVTAAEIYAEGGASTIEADERFWAAHELIEAGRRAEAEEQLEKALTFYRSVGATFFLERGERLLTDTQSASA
jgi:class 3 adenylate cyclase/tetratricopeptide (TPR) repeat protein